MYQLKTKRWTLALYGERIVGGKWSVSHRIQSYQANDEGWKQLTTQRAELAQRVDYRNLTIGAVPHEPDPVPINNYHDIEQLKETTWVIEPPPRTRLDVYQDRDDEVVVRIVDE